MRILVTGSRDWTDKRSIAKKLCLFIRPTDGQVVTLVSGNCPMGADFMAEEVARNLEWNVELHPANWELHGKRAGFIRNQEMVNAGADLCLAFIKNKSKGATMTANLSEEAGIKTHRFIEGDGDE